MQKERRTKGFPPGESRDIYLNELPAELLKLYFAGVRAHRITAAKRNISALCKKKSGNSCQRISGGGTPFYQGTQKMRPLFFINGNGLTFAFDKGHKQVEATALLRGYVSQAYGNWVEYARLQVRLAGQQIDPSEVVDDVVCSLWGSDLQALERMVRARANGRTELDCYMMRVIKISVISCRSRFRYQRGQAVTSRMEDSHRQLAEPASDFDTLSAYKEVRDVFETLTLSDRARDIFEWRFFEGKPFSEWQGPESQKTLYETFNRIFRDIAARIQAKGL